MVLFFQILLFFPMLPQWLPPGHSAQSPPRSVNFSAQTSASLHPSCSAAPAPLSLCCTGSLTLCCTGAPDSVLHWVSDSALHRVFDSALHWCPCRAAASFGASSSALYRRPVPATPHGCLKFCAVPAPPAGNTSWAPQALRCTCAPCRQQTSSGGEKYSGLASNLAHLGRIC